MFYVSNFVFLPLFPHLFYLIWIILHLPSFFSFVKRCLFLMHQDEAFIVWENDRRHKIAYKMCSKCTTKKKNTFKVCMDSCPKPMGLTHFKKQLKEKFVTLFRWENVIILEKFFSEIYCEILFDLLRLDRRQREK